MANVKVTWVLPTTRASGRPLPVGQIAEVSLGLSVDGQSFTEIDVFTPDVLETVVPDLEPGTWFFRGIVTDTAGRESAPAVASIEIEDDTPPGELTIRLSLA